MPADPLKRPALYLNRYSSLLAFNRRVLEQARDPRVPLLERLKFVCITSTNMDEFFEVRVAGLKQLQVLGSQQTWADNRSATETLRLISGEAHDLVALQYQVLNEEVLPALAAEHIYLLAAEQWNRTQKRWVREYFQEEVQPLLSPLGLDPAHPIPRILNKSLNFIMALEGKDAFGRNSALAIVQAPRVLPRVIALPPEIAPDGDCFVLLSSVIQAHVAELFPGMRVTGCYQFRVTRNSELFVDEEEIDDLLRAVEGELGSRRYGDEVRLEIDQACPRDISGYLLKHFDLASEDLYRVEGPVNLNRLMAILDLVDRQDLRYASFTPAVPAVVTRSANIFEAVRQQDLLLHHPFESFAPVIDLVRQAAADPDVLAIRQTLYRTGADSAIVELLRQAAQRGKEVTVVVELRARFDEEANISLATTLQEAGAHVVYGVVGYKTHAKLTWVVRREQTELRNYVHLGTGNYHARNVRLYTDYGLLTCDPEIADDVSYVFLQLTSLGRVPRHKQLLQSPFTLFKGLLARIGREAEHAKAGRPARIMLKVNGLTDREIIRALYQASQAGVKVDLIVRGMCCLRPQVEGLSEHIHVRSIIGRFLEHTRVYYFENNGSPEVFCSSADMMERNLHRRVEVCFPIRSPELRRRVVRETFDNYLADNTHAWILRPDGTYVRAEPKAGEPAISAQQTLLQQLSEAS